MTTACRSCVRGGDPDHLLEREPFGPTPNDVLLSLINQAVVHERAARAGIEVSEAEVESAVAGLIELLPRDAASLKRASGIDGLKRRVRAFLEFEKMRAIVLASSGIDAFPQAGAGATQPDEALSVFPVETAKSPAQAAWNRWLATARECARVEVLDLSFGIPSSTPAPQCRTLP